MEIQIPIPIMVTTRQIITKDEEIGRTTEETKT